MPPRTQSAIEPFGAARHPGRRPRRPTTQRGSPPPMDLELTLDARHGAGQGEQAAPPRGDRARRRVRQGRGLDQRPGRGQDVRDPVPRRRQDVGREVPPPRRQPGDERLHQERPAPPAERPGDPRRLLPRQPQRRDGGRRAARLHRRGARGRGDRRHAAPQPVERPRQGAADRHPARDRGQRLDPGQPGRGDPRHATSA